MDELTKQGIFGNKPKMYAFLREKTDLNSFFIKVFTEWLQDDKQVGKDNVHKIIYLLLRLYYDAIVSNPEQAIKILAYFMNGFPNESESDIVRPLYTWFESLNSWRNSLPTGSNPGDEYQVAQNSISTYQKGVELVGKILPILICLKKLSMNQEFNPQKIYNKYLGPKIREFIKSFDDNKDYYFIINQIDKDLRNAESHLDLRYDRIRKKYIYIVDTKEGRKSKHIPAHIFLLKYFPNPGYVIQGYLFSLMLIVALGQTRISEFKKIFSSLK